MDIRTPGQIGRFTFEATTGQTVTLVASKRAVAELCAWPLYADANIYDALGNLVAGGSCTPYTGSPLDHVTLPADGTYTLVFDPHGALTGTGTLRLRTNTPRATAALR